MYHAIPPPAAPRLPHHLSANPLLAHPGAFSPALRQRERDHLALLIDRRDGLGLGLPGGFVGLKEKVEKAAAREVQEETGLKVELGRLVTVLSGKRRGSHIYATCLIYEARITGDKVTRDSLEGKCRWIPLGQIETHRFAIDHFEALKLYRESKSHESADLKTNLRS